ncbi:thioredoxin domain-containing protein [Gordonia sp. ABSL1-1]|uniref:thioredoxin domain-containing protein n=1 Tax=Gordonia sp. ABSL1-1 TaxID=3053923 RepID=UPI002573CED1|nr:thioredoxin domain-containing protein [Gordonia sp. ABSL1-1]MDL9938901.1 thioredoxin domain-containing protein [Gordonia sp. ABSL1-1]
MSNRKAGSNRNAGASVPRATKSKYQPKATSSTMTYVLGGLAVAVIAALVITVVVLNNKRSSEGADEAVLAANATMTVGNATAPTIDVFEDPLCPICAEFEAQFGKELNAAVTGGKVRVRFHTLDFLNGASASGDYSSRAAGALTCVAGENNAALYLKFHSALFADQPKENGDTDHSNADLARIATQQGATPATAQCITSGAKIGEAKAKAEESTTQLAKALGGKAGTPSVLHNGEPVELNADWLQNIIGAPSN